MCTLLHPRTHVYCVHVQYSIYFSTTITIQFTSSSSRKDFQIFKYIFTIYWVMRFHCWTFIHSHTYTTYTWLIFTHRHHHDHICTKLETVRYNSCFWFDIIFSLCVYGFRKSKARIMYWTKAIVVSYLIPLSIVLLSSTLSALTISYKIKYIVFDTYTQHPKQNVIHTTPPGKTVQRKEGSENSLSILVIQTLQITVTMSYIHNTLHTRINSSHTQLIINKIIKSNAYLQ